MAAAPAPIPFRLVLGADDMGTKNYAACIIEYTAPPRRRKAPKRRKPKEKPDSRPAKRPRIEEAVARQDEPLADHARVPVSKDEAPVDDASEVDESEAAAAPAPAKIVSDGRGHLLRIKPSGHVVALDLDDDPMADDELGGDAETDDIPLDWDPELVEGERVRVLSFLYLDAECDEQLGTFDLDAELGKPHHEIVLYRHRTPDKSVLQTEVFRVISNRLALWDALYGKGWPRAWLELGPGWSVGDDDRPVPPAPDATWHPVPLYGEQQVDHLPGMRATTSAAKAINGRMASATVSAVAAHDLHRNIHNRRFGVVAGKAGVPRRKAKTESEKEKEDRRHKRRAVEYAQYFLEQQGQFAARDYLVELDKTIRKRCKEAGWDVPDGVDELKRTESVHSAECLLMAVKKARSIWRKTPLYPALKTKKE